MVAKTDQEIKEFIDSSKALTMGELVEFIYGEKDSDTSRYRNRKKTQNWWGYVLQTKNWGNLRDYREKKIHEVNRKVERFNKFSEIYQSDKRCQMYGKRRIRTLLNKVYNLDIPLPTLNRYIKELKCTQTKT
jgi:hypothetical protein